MAQTRCRISAAQLGRELGVTDKTAWRIFTPIRPRFDGDGGPLQGVVEADAAFSGAKPRHRQQRRGPRPAAEPTAQTPVVGTVQRGGDATAWVTPNARAKAIKPLLMAQ